MANLIDDQALDQLFRAARTQHYYEDRPVTDAQVEAIWDLMKMGPTSANQLPARLVWCRSDDAKARLAACALDSNKAKVTQAPMAVIIGMDLDFHEQLPELYPHADARSWFADDAALRRTSAMRNSSLQGGYFIMAARAVGLDVGPMSGFDNDAVDAAFFADMPTVRSNFIATIGYGDPKRLYPQPPRPAFERFNRWA